MSRASKITLAATGLGAMGIIAFVHWSQEAERVQMHKGVERDVERDMEKQRVRQERQADFDLQRALEREYRVMQNVSPGDGGTANGAGSIDGRGGEGRGG